MTTDILSLAGRSVRRLEHLVIRYFLVVVLFGMAGVYLIAVEEYMIQGFWDWLLLSCSLLFFLALRLAAGLPHRTELALTRLARRGTLDLSGTPLREFVRDFHARSSRWAVIGGLGGIGVTLASLWYLLATGHSWRPFFWILITGVASIVSYYAGYAASNGRLGNYIRSSRVTLRAQPGHLDGVAGLRPIGSLCLYQAILLAIPAFFLTSWLLIMAYAPTFGQTPTHEAWAKTWQAIFVVMLALVLITEVLAFVVPMLSFHRQMQEQKAAYQADADHLSQRIASLQKQVAESDAKDDVGPIKKRHWAASEYYQSIEQMPTWPVAPSTVLQFGISNLAVFVPVFVQVGLQQLLAITGIK